jgi:hypothetical protein
MINIVLFGKPGREKVLKQVENYWASLYMDAGDLVLTN